MLRYEIQHGSYYLLDERDNIHWMGDEVAVGFSYEPDEEDGGMVGTMHKHGSPEAVNKWAQTARAALSANGDTLGQEMANAIVVVSGKLPIEELTKIIEISGYVGKWYRDVIESGQSGQSGQYREE